MRLIDADKLKEELEVNGLGYQYYMLDNAPTVEAITVEWIKRYAKKGGRIANILFPFEIEMMLEDWEKKNEIDRCR